MLVDFWYGLFAAGVGVSLWGIYRLLTNEDRSNGEDPFTFILGFLLMVIVAINVGFLEVPCNACANGLSDYSGMAIYNLPLYAFALIDLALFFVSILQAIDIKKWKQQIAYETN